MKNATIKGPDDSSNYQVVESQSNQVVIEINPDHDSKIYHWFHFQLKGEAGQKYTIEISNANQSEYPPWAISYPDKKPYSLSASYDEKHWFNIPTTFNGKSLFWEILLKNNSISFATTIPYLYQRHLYFLTQLTGVTINTIGESVQGRPLSLITIGDESKDKLKYWIIARQHPGETMAQWFMEGLIQRLQQRDKQVIDLLAKATFYLIPNMNPDGTFLGNLRTNASGQDLNRCWLSPDEQKSPEVYFTLKKMTEIGVNFFLDVHTDEQTPAPFLMNGVDTTLFQLGEKFIRDYSKISPSIRQECRYQSQPPNTSHCAIGQRFHCLSLLLEMPFKAWNIENAIGLAELLLHPLSSTMKDLAKKPRLSESKHNVYSTKYQLLEPIEKTDNKNSCCIIF